MSDVDSQEALDALTADGTVVLAYVADADAAKFKEVAQSLRNDYTFARATGDFAYVYPIGSTVDLC